MKLVDPDKNEKDPAKKKAKMKAAFKVKSTKKARDDEKAELINEWRAQHGRVVVP